MKKLVVLCGLLFLVGCKKPVEVKQDSATATMASLVKLYASPEADQRARRVPEVLDPVLLHTRARSEACEKDALDVAMCEQRQNESFARCMSNKFACGKVEECAKYTDCACGAKGNDAVAKAAGFVGSKLDKGLTSIGFDPTKCTIADASEITGADYKKINPVSFQQGCGELKEADKMSAVTMSCGTQKMKFVLREAGGKWMLVGFDAMTEASFNVAGWASSEADKNKKKQDELNKDMK